MSGCSHDLHDLGGYVLGGLEPPALEEVQARLTGCAVCRAEATELREAVELLAARRTSAGAVPDRLRERVIADAALRRARRRWTAVASVAAVVAASLGGVLGRQLAPTSPADVAIPVAASEPYTATGWVTFSHQDGRPAMRLEVDGLGALPAPAVYEVWLSTDAGDVISVGRLDPVTDPLDVVVEVDGPWRRYRSMWVTAEPDARDAGHDGPTVLSAPVPRTGEPSAP